MATKNSGATLDADIDREEKRGDQASREMSQISKRLQELDEQKKSLRSQASSLNYEEKKKIIAQMDRIDADIALLEDESSIRAFGAVPEKSWKQAGSGITDRLSLHEETYNSQPLSSELRLESANIDRRINNLYEHESAINRAFEQGQITQAEAQQSLKAIGERLEMLQETAEKVSLRRRGEISKHYEEERLKSQGEAARNNISTTENATESSTTEVELRSPDENSNASTTGGLFRQRVSPPISSPPSPTDETTPSGRTIGKGTNIQFSGEAAGGFQIAENRGNTRIQELAQQVTSANNNEQALETKPATGIDAQPAIREAERIIQEASNSTTQSTQQVDGFAEKPIAPSDTKPAVEEAENIVSNSQKKSGNILKTIAKNSTPIGIAASVVGLTADKVSGESEEKNNQDSSSQPENKSSNQESKKRNLAASIAKNSTPVGIAHSAGSFFFRRTRGKSNTQDDDSSEQEGTSQVKPHKSGKVGKAGRLLLYSTPAGFMTGFLGSRAKQRLFAKKTVEDLGKEDPQKKKKHKGSRTLWLAKNMTPLGIAHSLTRLGFNKARGKTKKEQEESDNTKTTDSKKHKGSKILWLAKNMMPLGIAHSVAKLGANKTMKRKKSAHEYQKEWNDQKIALAKLRGFNPKAAFNRIRDLKVWKMRTWTQEGKTALISAQKRTSAGLQNAKDRRVQSFRGYGQNISTRFATLRSFTPRRIFGGVSTSGQPPQRGKAGIAASTAKSASKKLAGQALQQLEQKAVTAVLANPPVLLGIGIALLVVCLFVGILIIIITATGGGSSQFSGNTGGGGGNGGNNGGAPPGSKPIDNFDIKKDVDKTQITFDPSNPEKITYTISYSYNPPSSSSIQLSGITVYDKLDKNTTYLEASGNAAYDSSTNTVSWSLSDAKNTSPLSVTVKPNQDNVSISNKAYAEARAAGSGTIGGNSTLDELFKNSAANANVPAALLKAIARTESGVLSYTVDDVIGFNKANWWDGLPDDAIDLESLPVPISKGYAYNTCAFPKSNPICPGSDVRGVTQFELATWNGVVKPKLTSADGHTTDRRYVTDAIFGEGIFTRYQADQYDSRFHFSSNPTDWTEEQVKAMARTYCGGNPDANINQPACGNGTYDTVVWNYYQEYRAAGF